MLIICGGSVSNMNFKKEILTPIYCYMMEYETSIFRILLLHLNNYYMRLVLTPSKRTILRYKICMSWSSEFELVHVFCPYDLILYQCPIFPCLRNRLSFFLCRHKFRWNYIVRDWVSIVFARRVFLFFLMKPKAQLRQHRIFLYYKDFYIQETLFSHERSW